ncbi:TolC family outer membrane protein [Octadecabacter sp. SW4]|uniref:TolC family outer membrane protein n=1 Tax=Octadecabacter sp. SW4 TaxID=2602067 RepID=UPI0011C1DE78|nr:TolC family outer membrane protein [Octadecabacter sp. SW4]QEE36305.1 TolC family outer membrane protein [Octadecabacter sp. SW4]
MGLRHAISAICLASSVLLAPLVATAETLADALADAYENSGLLDQNRALLRAADEDVAQSLAALRPVISWAASAQYTGSPSSGADSLTNSYQISADLLIYDGGASNFATEAQKELVLATRQTLMSVEQQVLLRTVQAYVNVRSAVEFLSLRQNNVRVITQEFRAAQDRFDVGEVTRTDVALAEARLAAARSLLSAAEGSLVQASEEFNAVVGRRPDNLQPAAPAPLSYDLAAARAFAVRNHPDLLGQQHRVSAAELNIRRAEAATGPSVNLNGRVAVSDGEATESVGVTVSGPIYAGGRLASQIRQQMARRDAERAGLHITRAAVEQQVGNAYALLAVARASRDAFDRQIRAARVAFQGVREEATLGARTTLDVLNAEQELLDAQASMISAQSDEVVATYSVLAAMGLLNAQHLGLAVQTYDPSAYYKLVDEAPAALSEQGRALDRVLRALGE